MPTPDSTPEATSRAGLDGLHDDLSRQEGASVPAAYLALLEALKARVAEGAPSLSALRRAWASRSFDAWWDRPLLLLASLRFLALTDGEGHALGHELVHGELGTSPIGPRLDQALADPRLVPLLRDRAVQTNEPGRAIGWAVVAMALGFSHRRWALVDLGASAGLNLVADLTPIEWHVGTRKLVGLDLPSPGARFGVDQRPVDPRDAESARWLCACVWAGEQERFDRLDLALKAWREPFPEGRSDAPQMREGSLGTDAADQALRDAQDLVGGGPIVAFQSTVEGYLPPAVREAHATRMHAWLAQDPKRLWVRFEPTDDPPRTTPMALDVHHVPRGGTAEQAADPIRLARGWYHPKAVTVDPEAFDRLKKGWLGIGSV